MHLKFEVKKFKELPEIEDIVIDHIHDGIADKLVNCHDELMLTMLEQYGIDRNNLSEDNIKRVEIVTVNFDSREDVFVDGCYAFTIIGIPQVVQEWEKEGIFRADVGYIVKIYEHMKGWRTR